MAEMNKNNPWYYAKKRGRDYITPEDIGDVREANPNPTDACKIHLAEAVLEAFETGACEDLSCCAFVALKFLRGIR